MNKELTIQQKREAIRLKVVEKIPEILELKFGCKLIFLDSSEVVYVTDKSFFDDGKKSVTIRYERDGIMGLQSLEEHSFDSLFQVIGRPITALDIMRALEHNLIMLGHHGWLIMLERTSLETLPEITKDSHLVKLDLTQTLSEWSPECVDKLYELFYE